MLSKRVQVLSPSLTIAISSQARMMKANGEDVISLSAGEPEKTKRLKRLMVAFQNTQQLLVARKF